MTDCEKCNGPAPSKTICDACEESRTYQLVSDVESPGGMKLTRDKIMAIYDLPRCHRCGNLLDDTGRGCPSCGMLRPDPAREAEIDRRIHNMMRIHELEMSMTGIQRREWIEHGQYILNRDRGESVGFGLGEK